jgi:hypothetical protein
MQSESRVKINAASRQCPLAAAVIYPILITSTNKIETTNLLKSGKSRLLPAFLAS